MITLLAFMCVGFVLGIVWAATEKMNLSTGFDCWFYNLIVLGFFGVIGFYMVYGSHLAYTSGHTSFAITIAIFSTGFVGISGLAIYNIVTNGLPHKPPPKTYYFKGKEVPKGFCPD